MLTKEVEELILTESKKVLEDVTGEEFVLFMKILSGLKSLQTVSGRQQLVELVAEQADLEQAFSPSDPDCVDRLLQCTRQAVPLFSVSSLFHVDDTWVTLESACIHLLEHSSDLPVKASLA